MRRFSVMMIVKTYDNEEKMHQAASFSFGLIKGAYRNTGEVLLEIGKALKSILKNPDLSPLEDFVEEVD